MSQKLLLQRPSIRKGGFSGSIFLRVTHSERIQQAHFQLQLY